MGIQRDITARKVAEQSLLESESHFRKLIEFAPEAVLLLDLSIDRFTVANEAARRLFKLSSDDIKELTPSKMSPPLQPDGGDSEKLAAHWIAKALAGETPVFEWAHLDSQGGEVLCEVRLLRIDIKGRTCIRGSLTPIAERKRTENALKESELRYRTLFKANPQPMWVYDMATRRIMAVNNSAITHYGYSRNEFLSFTADEFRVQSELSGREFEAGKIERHRRKDHSIIEVEISSHELEFDGRPARIALAHDVTERRRMAIRTAGEREVLELLAADAPLTRILERITINQERAFPGMLCSVLLLDDDGRTLRHGAAPSLPRSYCDSIDGTQIGPAVGSCGTAAFTKKTVIADNIATDPRWKDYSALALGHGLRACWSVPLISSEDTVLGTLALYYREPAHPTDLESSAIARGAHFASIAIERQKLRQSVHENRVRLETLVQNLPGMAYRCRNDEHSIMTYVSDGCEALTGYRRDELENNKSVSYGELIHADDRDWLWEKSRAAFEARLPSSNEYRIAHRDGSERWVAERASGEYAPDGTLLYIDGFIQDITVAHRAKTEREQLDRKMQEAQKLESLGVLAGGIAHDFNNLLTSILGNASIANLSLPPGSDAYNCVDQIVTTSMRTADLCKQMLAYSGRGRFVVQRLDLSELVEQTTQMLQISISKKAALRFHLEKGLPPIEADATQIRQIIMNLVINASEAIGDSSGAISLSTGLTQVDRDYLRGTLTDEGIPDGDYVFLEVSDSGCGMSSETKARIFDPFFTTKFTGRGLGLAAVLGIVRGHRGSMKVYSEPGCGSTFKILFPATGGAAEKQEITPGTGNVRRYSGTVLIVDDEETVRTTVCRMMEILGFQCVLATDGRQGVDIAAKDPSRFSMVLLDLTMPHMDGEQAFTELRRLRSDIRVVLMSGFNAQEALVKFSGKGLASFLQKPFTLSALKGVLNDVLA
jgi:PAS domain S-box-containing protein